MQDYRVKVKFVNNRILELMEREGIRSVSELCRILNFSDENKIGDLINMKISPINLRSSKTGRCWKPIVLKMADLFGVLPDDMFNEQQIYEPLKKNNASVKVTSAQLNYFIEHQRTLELPTPEEAAEKESLSNAVNDVLKVLGPRYQKVLMLRFGLGDHDCHTLKDTGTVIGVTQERVRQMEAKALRLLRQPKHANKLKADLH